MNMICRPCPPSAVDRWKDALNFKRLLQEWMQEAINDGTIVIPPRKGVRDGSKAKPGEIGEVVSGSVTVPPLPLFTIPDTNINNAVQATVMRLPAGDWQISTQTGVILDSDLYNGTFNRATARAWLGPINTGIQLGATEIALSPQVPVGHGVITFWMPTLVATPSTSQDMDVNMEVISVQGDPGAIIRVSFVAIAFRHR